MFVDINENLGGFIMPVYRCFVQNYKDGTHGLLIRDFQSYEEAQKFHDNIIRSGMYNGFKPTMHNNPDIKGNSGDS